MFRKSEYYLVIMNTVFRLTFTLLGTGRHLQSIARTKRFLFLITEVFHVISQNTWYL